MKIEEGEILHFCTENTPEVVARQMVRDQERINDLKGLLEQARGSLETCRRENAALKRLIKRGCALLMEDLEIKP